MFFGLSDWLMRIFLGEKLQVLRYAVGFLIAIRIAWFGVQLVANQVHWLNRNADVVWQ